LRKELGVWYTPPEIVEYMVGRVDQLLRSELGIADGLADEQVFVLDPAAGTGSYLVEVARRIHQTLTDQGHGSLAAARVKRALRTRIFGFEILPAPYVVAHLQLGVFLRSLGATLTAQERFEVFLTNALTGWEPPKEPKRALLFSELQEEAERATKVKRNQPILVILGNPPYNRFAGVAEDEEADLIEPFKRGLYEKWGIRKQLLDDLYIRFFRLAEKRIAEVGGRGIVCYISNYSWLEGLSHPVMRERLATGFDLVLIDNCNGDKFKTGKRTPDGRPDESMFTTDDHRVGIQVGTAITSLVKRGPHSKNAGPAQVFYRDLWGTGNEKRSMLCRSEDVEAADHSGYASFSPQAATRWVFVDVSAGQSASKEAWPKLADLFPVHYSGLNENRCNAFITIDRDEIERRMKVYFDGSLSLEEIAERVPRVNSKAAGYDPAQVRTALLRSAGFIEDRIVPLSYRPFDMWWTYWEGRSKLFNRPRPDFFAQVWPGNVFIAASQTARKGGLNEPIVVNTLGDLHLQDPWSQFFPLLIRVTGELGGDRVDPNIDSKTLDAMCSAFGIMARDEDQHGWTEAALDVAQDVFYHTLAITWSPAYRTENEAALRQDWPRVPIPADRDLLSESAGLGRAVADLLLPDRPVRGVTCGTIRPELRGLGVPSKAGGGNIDPGADLKVEATWGFFGAKNAVMCGKGKSVSSTADPSGALDVYINDRVYWQNIPLDVWAMTIGGYPVVKKWLSYREFRVLGRPLFQEEMTYVTEVVRRLKSLLWMGESLDANYRAAATNSMEFSKSS
jgi:predicted helicase